MKERAGIEKDKLRDKEIEIEEAMVPKVPGKVYTPSPDEYDKHCATHLPYRNWCPICVQAKKRNPAHGSKKDENKHKYIPVISIDYMFLNEKGDELNNPILAVHDSMSEGVWAVFLRRKGGSSYAAKKVSDIIKRLGYSKIVLKSDQEPAIKSLEDRARESLWQETEEMMKEIKE